MRSLILQRPRITDVHPFPLPTQIHVSNSKPNQGYNFRLIEKYTIACLTGSCSDTCILDSCSTMLNGQIYNRAILCWLHFTAKYLLRLRADPEGRLEPEH